MRSQIVSKIAVILVLVLFLNLPVVSALEISNVRAEEITENSATILWDTDEESNSFVDYGKDKDSLTATGDAKQVTQHNIKLSNLDSESSYVYKVRSQDITDDKGGSLYSFETTAPDTAAPELVVEFPPLVAGTELEISGTAEAGASLTLFLNEVSTESTTAEEDGSFSFQAIFLEAGKTNNLRVDAVDSAGNVASVSGIVLADTSKPVIELEALPETIEQKSYTLKGTISENSSYKIILNNKSVATGEGSLIEKQINLDEGVNKINIILTDGAGWTNEQEFLLTSDTQKPVVKAEIEKGKEYFEGRAVSSIHGTTEPGAKVYLYVYKPLGYEFNPDFKKARAVHIANDEGEFTFNDVNFGSSILDITLDDISPTEVPSGLQEVTIYPISEVAQQQKKNYFVYLIAEDSTGKTDSWQQQVTVNSCFSGFDFSVQSVPEMQTPYRLNPELMKDGRQEIQALFALAYNGDGISTLDAQGEVIESGYKITNVKIEKACTKTMQDDDVFGIGCKILPNQNLKPIISPDGSHIYASWNLLPSKEFIDNEKNFWDDFAKRQLMLPLKISISYQEKEGAEKYGNTKTDSVCYDLGYFVDIPANINEYVPDKVLDGGITFLNDTINVLHDVNEVVEQVYFYTGIVAMVSAGLVQVARFARIMSSKWEYFTTVVKPKQEDKNKGCPLNTNGLYLEDTIKAFCEMPDSAKIPKALREVCGDDEKLKVFSLDQRCPTTAGMWEWEEKMFTIPYRWSWDRTLCREVPARWTEDKELDDINKVILEQRECSVTGKGDQLVKVENCKKLIDDNKLGVPKSWEDHKNEITTCWRYGQTVYLPKRDEDLTIAEKKNTEKDIYLLQPLPKKLSGELTPPDTELLVYKPKGSEAIGIAPERSCEQVCSNKKTPGFKSLGCRSETVFNKTGKVGIEFTKTNEYLAGYTSDCFIEGMKVGKTAAKIDAAESAAAVTDGEEHEEEDTPAGDAAPSSTTPSVATGAAVAPTAAKTTATATEGEASESAKGDEKIAKTTLATPPPSASGPSDKVTFEQCVCGKKDSKEDSYKGDGIESPREADIEEEWFYRQERLFKESKKNKGTYYPKERYYEGRDLSGAFGANYLPDYLRDKEEAATVNPHGIIGSLQTVCVSTIYKNLIMLENILTGVQGCLIESKTSSFQDAGICKSFMSQQVCGLVYKAISAVTNQCTPSNFDDVSNTGAFGDVGAFLSMGTDSLAESLDSSVQDLKDDYGNSHLNNFFEGGTAGFAQSMCLVAFGQEFPMFSQDFWTEAAYAVPTTTIPIIAPASREQTSYNPATQTAIFNYDIAGAILPGCRIKKWDLKLKCVGPEDQGGYNLDPSCDGEGCDCLNVYDKTAFEGEKTKLLKSGFNLQSSSLFNIPLPSPQKVESHYRYDHVILDMYLDPSEKGNENKCFDTDAVIDGSAARYYFPITDYTFDQALTCNVNFATGRYECPQLASLFGFGGTYLEPPYVSCFNKNTGSWLEDCTAPNLFIKGDTIKTKVYINNDDKGKCLLRKVSPAIAGVNTPFMRQIPSGVPGLYPMEDNVGVVNSQMFGGASNVLQKVPGESNQGCGSLDYASPPDEVISGKKFKFEYEVAGDNKYRLKKNDAVSISTAGFSWKDGYLYDGTTNSLGLGTLNDVQFNLDGFLAKGVLGNPISGEKQYCTYQTTQSSGYSEKNVKVISVTYQLLEKDEGGTCNYANTPIKAGSNPTTKTVKIRLQEEISALAADNGMHGSFIAGNYDEAFSLADGIMGQKGNDLTNALAIYYATAVTIMKFGVVGDYLENLLGYFFERKWDDGVVGSYPGEVTSTTEYGKIKKYMCEVDKVFTAVDYSAMCGGVVSSGVVVSSGGSCASKGADYSCRAKSLCVSSTIESGLCPGGSDNKCCKANEEGKKVTSTCTSVGDGYECRAKSLCDSGTIKTGKCPGGSDNKCCKEK
jgi:hypothetical protein